MITVDTNVLLRIFIDDNPSQNSIAREIATSAKQIFVPQVIQVEVVWVLQKVYKLSKQQILQILLELYENDAFKLQNNDIFYAAYMTFKNKNVGFSDSLILAAATAHSGIPIYTFDKKFAKVAGVRLAQ